MTEAQRMHARTHDVLECQIQLFVSMPATFRLYTTFLGQRVRISRASLQNVVQHATD